MRNTIKEIFVDLDGVLADFDEKVERLTGLKPDAPEKDQVMWDKLEKIPHFYLDLKLMPGARDLWNRVERYQPTILTAVPSRKTPMQIESANDKVVWVAQNFGNHVSVIVTLSKLKHTCGKPGDVLIDDRKENIDSWIEMGGIGILHINVEDTLTQLNNLGL